MKKLHVALVGLGFGGAFAEIYRDHPHVACVGLYDADPAVTERVSQACGLPKRYGSFEAILADDAVDAVHLVTPIPLHEAQTVRVLEAGKHCACTVPMALSLEGIERIVRAVGRSGRNYMMMETSLYTRPFLHAQQLLREGRFGRIQFLRGAHYQDMANWPAYWNGLPPMLYGTHAIAPLVVLAESRIRRVCGFGSGTMRQALVEAYGNPYPVECALMEFGSGLKAEVTRTLFETARTYQEGFSVYGSEASFEWGHADEDAPLLTTPLPQDGMQRGRAFRVETLKVPNRYQTLPAPLQRFTVGGAFDPLNPQDSLTRGAGGGHHGSHPHLVHEFVMSIVENRKPRIDEHLGGNITAAGICAHTSAMRQGEPVDVPTFAPE